MALDKSTLLSIVRPKSALASLVPFSSPAERNAQKRFAPVRSAPLKSVPTRLVAWRLAVTRFDSASLAPSRSAPSRSVPGRSAPRKSAPPRSNNTSGYFCRHAWTASAPFFTISTCSGFAMFHAFVLQMEPPFPLTPPSIPRTRLLLVRARASWPRPASRAGSRGGGGCGGPLRGSWRGPIRELSNRW